MQHLSAAATATGFFHYARRGALLLALGVAGPAAWAQSFGPVALYATGTGSMPRSVALGDVNRDGRLDIVTACGGTGAAGVLLAQPSGFAPVQTYATGSGTTPSSVALGDTNGDGWLDIIAANNGTFLSRQVQVLMGQAGGFGAVARYDAGNSLSPTTVKAGDANADGLADVLAVDASSNEVTLLNGQSTGLSVFRTFPAGTGNTPYDVALGDVNGDGRPDIVTANSNRTVGVMLAQAGGGYAAPGTYLTANLSVPRSVALADVNRDGRLDIIVAGDGGFLSVLLGQANGFPATSSNYATNGSFSNGVALGDVNGDGWLDAVTSNYGSNTVSVLLGQSAGGFAQPVTYSTGAGSQPMGVAVDDVNGDRRPDIIVANSGSNAIGVLLNAGTYTPLATARPTAADLTLAPNPAHNAFTVQLPAGLAPTSAELLNALGQVVRRPAVGAASFSVETSGLAPGLYTLRLLAGGAALARRVVVE